MEPRTSLVAAAALAMASVLIATAPAASAAPREAESDFNGDGYSDLVSSSPLDGTTAGRGAVYVVPGSANGIVPAQSRIFTFADSVVGSEATAGDFDGDGYDDLAVASEPGYSSDMYGWTGNVRVLFGSASGLSTTRLQLLAPGAGGVPSTTTEFGSPLSAGDYDGDGDDDLAVGSTQGLWVYDGDDGGVDDTPTAMGAAGRAMDSGDLDGDGFDELVVGGTGAGYLSVLPGAEDGLSATPRQQLSMSELQQTGTPAPRSIVVGEFGRGAELDVAVGNQVGNQVSVVYGTDEGLTTTGLQMWDRTTLSSIPGAAQAGGGFGTALAAADLGYSTYDDLAIGAFQDTVRQATDAGSVTVLVGTADGLVVTHGKRWTQDTTGVPGLAEKDDWFGQHLQAGLFTKSSKSGLGISAPYEAIGTKTRAGGVTMLYGSSTALTTSGSSFLTQDTPGMAGVVEKGDTMGFRGPIQGEETR